MIDKEEHIAVFHVNLQQDILSVVRGRSKTMLTIFWLPPCVNIFYGINIDEKWTFLDHLPTYLPCLVNVVWERPLIPKSSANNDCIQKLESTTNFNLAIQSFWHCCQNYSLNYLMECLSFKITRSKIFMILKNKENIQSCKLWLI